ncbi:hypothetical protein C3B51_23280, partial [Pseudoalteromonas rubra]
KDGWTQKYGKAGEPLHAIYERVKGAQTETFSYDANGNQLSATVHLNGRTHTRTLAYQVLKDTHPKLAYRSCAVYL